MSTFALAWSFGFDFASLRFTQDATGFDWSIFLLLLALLLISGLLGSIALTLGALVDANGYDVVKRTALARKVGETENPLLIQGYNDAVLRYEAATGLRGFLIFSVLCAANRFFSHIGTADSATTISAQPSFSWPVFAGVTFSLLFNWMLSRSSVEAFEALQKIVDQGHKPATRGQGKEA